MINDGLALITGYGTGGGSDVAVLRVVSDRPACTASRGGWRCARPEHPGRPDRHVFVHQAGPYLLRTARP